MARTPKRRTGQVDTVEQDIRDQEVLRANKELAAYFRGQRTEREARSALKIIKRFIQERERLAPEQRRPLPGGLSTKIKTKSRNRGNPAPAKEPHDHAADSHDTGLRRADPADAAEPRE